MSAYRYTRAAVAMTTAAMLTACAVPNNPSNGEVDRSYPGTAQDDAAAATPSHYRGTESGVSAVSGDAAINADVIAALSRLPGQEGTNLQVTTSGGIVTLRGVANTAAAAQQNVLAARQVPGVQRVDYDIQVTRP